MLTRRREGVHVQASWFKGEFCDDVVLAILRTEWIERKFPAGEQ